MSGRQDGTEATQAGDCIVRRVVRQLAQDPTRRAVRYLPE